MSSLAGFCPLPEEQPAMTEHIIRNTVTRKIIIPLSELTSERHIASRHAIVYLMIIRPFSRIGVDTSVKALLAMLN